MQLRLTALARTFVLLVTSSWAIAPVSADVRPLNDTAWVLVELPGVELLPGTVPTLSFDGARAAGTDGCNRFSATYTVKGSALQISTRAAATQMACPPAVMRVAGAFMTALVGARSASGDIEQGVFFEDTALAARIEGIFAAESAGARARSVTMDAGRVTWSDGEVRTSGVSDASVWKRLHARLAGAPPVDSQSWVATVLSTVERSQLPQGGS